MTFFELVGTVGASALGGGGLMAAINWRTRKKKDDLEFAKEAMKFMKEENVDMRQRVTNLELEVKSLQAFKCFNEGCTKRRAIA
jgi:hypothetical protein